MNFPVSLTRFCPRRPKEDAIFPLKAGTCLIGLQRENGSPRGDIDVDRLQAALKHSHRIDGAHQHNG